MIMMQTDNQYYKLLKAGHVWKVWGVQSRVTRLCNLLHFGTLFKACATIILPKLLTFLAIFVKVSKSFICLLKSFLGNFYRHLVTFLLVPRQAVTNN